MKKALIMLGVLCSVWSFSDAHAGKPERDKKDELEPTITAASKELSDSCGCPIKISVNWASYASADSMFRIEAGVDAIKSSVRKHCEKDADKKAVCANLSEFAFSSGSNNAVDDPTYKDKVIGVQSTDIMYNNDSQIDHILDKW